jgi:hypothetical protein
MGVFDQAARYAAQAEPEAAVTRLLSGLGLPLRFREWMDTRTTPRPGDPDRTADRVAALIDESAPDRPWLLVLEFQAQHDPDKLDVTLAEAGQLRIGVRHGEGRRGKYNVLAALVYLRGQCPEGVLDMTVPGGFGTRHAPLVWNVAEDSAAEAIESLAAGRTTWGVLFWIPLMRGGHDPALIERWKEQAAAVPDRRVRGDLAQIALVFAELAGCYPAWEKGLEGWDMTEPQVVNRWIEKARAEARLEEARAFVLRALQRRFPGDIPPEVVATINAQPSATMLEGWFDQAMSSASMEEFIAALRR